MKYLCLAYADVARIDASPGIAPDGLLAEILAFREELRESGHGVAAGALDREAAATTITVRHGALSIDEEPPAAPKGHLTEFALIEAADLNEAIRWAAKMPPARLGYVEIWAVDESGREQARGAGPCSSPRAGA